MACTTTVPCALCAFAPTLQCAECALIETRLERDRALTEARLLRAKIDQLELRVRELATGLSIRGWWCFACDIFNGEEHSKRTECRHCGLTKVVCS